MHSDRLWDLRELKMAGKFVVILAVQLITAVIKNAAVGPTNHVDWIGPRVLTAVYCR